MIRRVGNMPPEEIFSRTFIGIVLIFSSFFTWGQWVMLGAGILFVFSALSGFCLTCYLYKKFTGKSS